MRDSDRVLGTLYGQAIGDALGMPSELWPIQRIRAVFPDGITSFVDGPPDNDIACNYSAGEYTDDTSQAFAILDALIETDWRPVPRVLVEHILAWAERADAWRLNILGPSSKAALTLVREGKDATRVTGGALTNGCGMRIAPIGTLFEPDELDALVTMVRAVTSITHSSDVTLGGAALIAGAVCAAAAGRGWDDIIVFAAAAHDRAEGLGAPTWAASCRRRMEIGVDLARFHRDDAVGDGDVDRRFARDIYEVIGTGTMASESIPAAASIAYYARDVTRCARLCANLGGDTDTIGAMATAICGAACGAASIPPSWRTLIDRKNPQHDIGELAGRIMAANAVAAMAVAPPSAGADGRRGRN